ncbi:MAG: dTMP kinase, partial [Candidatus Delongbacteria bacterium]|nr:dTMP kinase [Candidatus Delongbacteria bacterium]
LKEKGYIVILDRFLDSTTAYQGYGRGIDLDIIKKLNYFATLSGKYIPDITFFIDLAVEKSLGRILSRGEEINRMESSKMEFFEKVRNGFLEISQQEHERVFRIDGSETVENVFRQIETILKSRNFL